MGARFKGAGTRKRRSAPNFFMKNKILIKIAIILQIVLAPTQGFSYTHLRPTATGSDPTEIKTAMLQNPVSETMLEYFGDGTSPSFSSFGTAAILSRYSASEIAHSIKYEGIEEERGKLKRLHEYLAGQINSFAKGEAVKQGIARS